MIKYKFTLLTIRDNWVIINFLVNDISHLVNDVAINLLLCIINQIVLTVTEGGSVRRSVVNQ